MDKQLICTCQNSLLFDPTCPEHGHLTPARETQFDATAYAARLGVTRDVFPEWFVCARNVFANGVVEDWICTLPPPDSDDPRACLWEPALIRALGWRHRVVVLQGSNTAKYGTTLDAGWHDWPKEWFATPTAALAAAFDAKEAK